jgi:hypothetical protein
MQPDDVGGNVLGDFADMAGTIRRDLEVLLETKGPQYVAQELRNALSHFVAQKEHFEQNAVGMCFSHPRFDRLLCEVGVHPFHTLARFLGYSRSNALGGNVCVAFSVQNETLYFAANRETNDELEDRTFVPQRNHPFYPFRNLVDVGRRTELFQSCRQEMHDRVADLDLSFVPAVENVNLREMVLDHVMGLVTDNKLGEKVTAWLGPLPDFCSSFDAMLREVLRLCHEAQKTRRFGNHDNVVDSILCCELVALQCMVPKTNLERPDWPDIFFRSVARYVTWKVLSAYAYEVLQSVLVESTDAATVQSAVDSNALVALVGQVLSESVAFEVGCCKSRRVAVNPRDFVSLCSTFSLVRLSQQMSVECHNDLNKEWQAVKQPLWWPKMKASFDKLRDVKEVVMISLKDRPPGIDSTNDLHCELMLHQFHKMNDIPMEEFFISLPTCGQCSCYLFGCVSSDKRPSILAASLHCPTQLVSTIRPSFCKAVFDHL